MLMTIVIGNCGEDTLMMRRGCIVSVVAMSMLAAAAHAQITARQVEAALGLLPPEARAGAEILVPDASGFIVHRAGTNGWSCRVWTPAERLAANCHHRVLRGKIDMERRLSADGMSGAAVREHLADALRTGRLSIPRGSVEISGSGELVGDAEVPHVMDVYYLVYFPFESAKSLGVPTEDPGGGGPWLHHGGTADAHLMWQRAHTPEK